MAYIPLIDTDTGEIDRISITERAHLRAAREWGGPAPSPAYIRQAFSWCWDRAQAERLQWRQQRGLPDESPCILVDISTWTDSFGRQA